ncbi:MAG: mobile mystery protein A [Proteobacteria bacterium]|nr:mobile mystery protein A [Desulfocapsa sp.]MBU3943132.1 mobile mystery protein A [Pseudomonadota bacterium]MCG2745710.1 mobile mystery protein A [Desulfobacteraceae bacterium]MBU4041575.1 mobile mystery protein A [Pseudomonadota bacterium]MBU4108389.1 mobile mystery protein A [Pseudomonadota bacterium]
MKTKYKQIARRQLDATLAKFSEVRKVQLPPKGWIRAVREALGMSGKQLAGRLNVSQPRVHKLEQSEPSGALTLKTMRQVAEALDCVFVYALVPRSTLEETVRAQARAVATERLQRVSHTMLLEAQGLSTKEQQASLDDAIEELARETPKDLWDMKP